MVKQGKRLRNLRNFYKDIPYLVDMGLISDGCKVLELPPGHSGRVSLEKTQLAFWSDFGTY